ncbi:curli-like amyloid fiber formation chaperone CsgH [Devosia epidermidihirudinis]|uniref:curli-like amyloid fiber formation chaperone CsgH n=1 Tax=Devosia epidermidihirudinis TaxID=1293439 RepID=UPI000AF159AE|nr:curli-like amyloid fiber formation chaperone CsgH [Devosia epidermidihirudinis]
MITTKLLAIPALLGVGLIGGNLAYANASTGPTQCSIQTTLNGNVQSLQGIILSDVNANGTYQFSVRSSGPSGSSNINQGGNFTARAAEPVIVGQVQLNASAKTTVSFTVTLGNKTIDCAAHS